MIKRNFVNPQKQTKLIIFQMCSTVPHLTKCAWEPYPALCGGLIEQVKTLFKRLYHEQAYYAPYQCTPFCENRINSRVKVVDISLDSVAFIDM